MTLPLRKKPRMSLLRAAVQLSALALTLLAVPQIPGQAQQSETAPGSSTLDEILSGRNRVHSIGQLAVSPDGKRLAWLQAGAIHVGPIDRLDQNQRVTAATPDQSCQESNFTWSPDSSSL